MIAFSQIARKNTTSGSYITRAVHQGDTLAPYLFVILVDYMMRVALADPYFVFSLLDLLHVRCTASFLFCNCVCVLIFFSTNCHIDCNTVIVNCVVVVVVV
jgi:hypothetical protein